MFGHRLRVDGVGLRRNPVGCVQWIVRSTGGLGTPNGLLEALVTQERWPSRPSASFIKTAGAGTVLSKGLSCETVADRTHLDSHLSNTRHGRKMPRPAVLAVVLMIGLCVTLCSGAPRYDDDPKGLAERDVQMWRDMTLQMLQQVLRANGDFGPIYHHKRNSEIINSLLGLPKTMTEAGRK